MINTYLKASPDNIKMQNIEGRLDAKNDEVDQSKNEELRNITNNLIGSYKSVISENANLREASTLNGKVLTALPRGTNIYMHDTQVESVNGIWCDIHKEDGFHTILLTIQYNRVGNIKSFES